MTYFSGEIEIYFTFDFWDSLDLSIRTLLGRKQFTVEKVVDFGDLISIAIKLIKKGKWVISQINPDDFWVKTRQMFEFKYFYNKSRIKVVSPFLEENRIDHLEAETVVRQKGEKRKTITFDKNSTISQ